jgi:O-antigen/teichoic acid export membrane protein
MTSQRLATLGVFWGVVERATTQGVSFVVVLLLARLLGPETYGLVTLAATIALLGQSLLGETFSQALIQQKALEPAHASSLFWILLCAGLAASLLQIALADSLAALFGEPDLAPILRALAPLLFIAALQAVPAALFKRELRFRALAAASVTGTMFGGIAGVALAYSGFGPWSIVANLLIQNALITASIWRQSPFRPSRSYSFSRFADLWSYGQYTLLLRVAAFTANQGPRILVGYLFGPIALGAFSLGLRMIEMLYQLLTLPAVNVAIAVIAKLRDEPKGLERAILDVTQLSVMISAPIFVMLALIAPFVVPLLFGPQWTESVTIIQILCAYGVVGACGLIWGSIIAGLGRPDITLRTTSIAAIVSLVILLLTARYGLAAASIAFVVRGYVTLPFMPIVIARLTGISARKQYGVLIPILGSVALMGGVVEALIIVLSGSVSPLTITATALGSGAAIYALALYVFASPALKLSASFLAQLRPNRHLSEARSS